MHKRIVKAIMEALSQRDEKLLDFVVHDKKTDGFWKLEVIVKVGYKHLIPHIESIGVSIGRFYGEGLHLEKKANKIIFY